MGVKGVKVLGGGSHTDQNPPQSFSCDSQLSTSNPSVRCEGSQARLQPNLLQKNPTFLHKHTHFNTINDFYSSSCHSLELLVINRIKI